MIWGFETRAGDILVRKPPFSMNDVFRRLTTREPSRDLPVLLLTLVTATRGLSLARGGTATSSDPFVVGTWVTGERG